MLVIEVLRYAHCRAQMDHPDQQILYKIAHFSEYRMVLTTTLTSSLIRTQAGTRGGGRRHEVNGNQGRQKRQLHHSN